MESYCAMIELGLIENKELRTVTLNRTGKTRLHPRYIKLGESPSRVLIVNRRYMKDICKSIREGKLTYDVHKLHPGHNKITLNHNPYGDP